MNNFKITIGDWSQDGHNQYLMFAFETNISIEDLQNFYKKSCEKTGVDFRKIAFKYGDSSLSPELASFFQKNGFDLKKYNCHTMAYEQGEYEDEDDNELNFYCHYSFAEFILDFTKKYGGDFTYRPLPIFKRNELKALKSFNGFWDSKGLNAEFGYGLFNV